MIQASIDDLNLNEPILSNNNSEGLIENSKVILEEEDSPVDQATKEKIKNVLVEKPPQQNRLSNFEVFVLQKLAKLNAIQKDQKQRNAILTRRGDLTDEYAYLLL